MLIRIQQTSEEELVGGAVFRQKSWRAGLFTNDDDDDDDEALSLGAGFALDGRSYRIALLCKIPRRLNILADFGLIKLPMSTFLPVSASPTATTKS